MTDQPEILTVGHSTHPIDRFIALLQRHGVTAIADVRSQPFSRYAPQFNKAELTASLRQSGIQYVFLGKELGARGQTIPTATSMGVCNTFDSPKPMTSRLGSHAS